MDLANMRKKQQRLDGLSHPLPVLRRGLKRRSQPMNEMTLSSEACCGFHTGVVRGLRFLAESCRTEWASHFKSLAGKSSGDPMRGSCTVDAQAIHKFEHLPLSLLLLSHISSLRDMTTRCMIDKLWDALETLERPAVLKLDVCTDAQPRHEDILGLVVRAVRLRSLLPWRASSTCTSALPPLKSRCPGKHPGQNELTGEAHFVITVFACAAFVEQTEKRHCLHGCSVELPRNVYNLHASELRALANLIDEERTLSQTLLITHICAMCGHLLQPAASDRTATTPAGLPGVAHHIRGEPCTWDAMTPFVLVYSKPLLARRLPFCFTID